MLLRQRLGEAEVEDLHRAVGADSDVGRLQVAVNDALVMRGFERVGNLFRNRQRVGKRHRTARDERRQVVTRDQLHDERKRGARVLEPIDSGDVRMIERGQDLRFAPKSGEPLRIGREEGGKDFERDLAIEFGIPGAIDLAHTAGPDSRQDFVRGPDGRRVQGTWAAAIVCGSQQAKVGPGIVFQFGVTCSCALPLAACRKAA